MNASWYQAKFPRAYWRGVRARLKEYIPAKNEYKPDCDPNVPTEYKSWQAGYESTIPFDEEVA